MHVDAFHWRKVGQIGLIGHIGCHPDYKSQGIILISFSDWLDGLRENRLPNFMESVLSFIKSFDNS